MMKRECQAIVKPSGTEENSTRIGEPDRRSKDGPKG